MVLSAVLDETVAVIRKRVPKVAPRLGLVLGSGLGGLVDDVQEAKTIPYAALPHFPEVSVVGHGSQLVLGLLYGCPVAVLQGRVHGYEGHPAALVAYPVRTLARLGVEALLVTNAAGGVNPDYKPGELMALTDHLNLSGHNPLTGPNDPNLGPRFPDLTRAYDPGLLEVLRAASVRAGIPLREGVYAHLAGPSYETPAEIRMLRILGADAVGMSTVPEVIVARHQGVRVAGVSCITNVSPSPGTPPLSHEEVTRVAAGAARALSQLVAEFARGLSDPREVT